MEGRGVRRGEGARQRATRARRARKAVAAAPAGKAGAAVAPINGQQARRLRTEQRLIEAFGRVVARDGLYNVRVNELAREAGVGKRQLYQYFGGLAGVANAWSRAGMQAPAPRRPVAPPGATVEAGTAGARLAEVLLAYAARLRDNPTAVAALQGQLGGPPDMAAAFRQVRASLRKEQLDAFLGDPRLRQPEYVALYSVLYAAINYVALRARFAPAFNGLDLATDAGWEALMDMFRAVVAGFERGAGPRRGAPRRAAARGDGA